VSVPHLISSYEWEHGLSGRAVAVYRWLAWRENVDTGRCDPSHHDIAQGTGFGVTTVRKALEELREAGLVTWKGRARDRDRGRTSNAYYLTPTVGGRTDLTPRDGDWSGDQTPTVGDAPADSRVGPPQHPAAPSPTVGEQELEVELEVEKEKERVSDFENEEERRETLALLRDQAEDPDLTPSARRLAAAQAEKLAEEMAA
jgi:hypothetical protein